MKAKGENLLSIVIPVHKMAGKLQNLSESLRGIENHIGLLQVIVIHDGTDSDTQRELEKLKTKFRFELHQGTFDSPGLARNFGLQKAQSAWITFWDSDDIGNANEVIQAIYESPTEVDLIVGKCLVSRGGQTRKLEKTKTKPRLHRVMINPGLWRFVFKKEMIGRNRFIQARMGEDQVFLAELKLDEHKIGFSKRNFYTYFSGTPLSLTSNMMAIRDLKNSIKQVEHSLISSKRIRSYIYVIYSRMLFTGLKNKLLNLDELISHTIRNKKFSPKQRFVAVVFTAYVVSIRALESLGIK